MINKGFLHDFVSEFSPVLVTYNALIYAYCSSNRVDEAVRILRGMPEMGLSPDSVKITRSSSLPYSVTFSVFLNGLDKKAWTRETKERVLHWIYDMVLSVPTNLAYDTLIENCSINEFKSLVGLVKGFCIKGLENAYDTMLQWNYKPDGAAYNMYTEMVHYGFASHVLSVLTLIDALYNKRMGNELSWVIQNTLRSCNLNDSELKAMARIDGMKGKIDALLNVLAEKVMDGLLLNGGKCLIGAAPNYKGLPSHEG
ncbi:pentatricopeptide repeat-containing protein At5g39710-like [Lotus japonicus]|uniref:pentatricopeptide repeat-containing protein At5g39710-like n=1 Tax=Lotus japonicus TaxID=34305 RepID=UPI00258E4F0D|nr:pentatricopeptide repeat-containing protein At5g39710-like [Lotus japonicus]